MFMSNYAVLQVQISNKKKREKNRLEILGLTKK